MKQLVADSKIEKKPRTLAYYCTASVTAKKYDIIKYTL